MFCKDCGAKLRDGAKFCPSCGRKIIVNTAPGQTPVVPPSGTGQPSPVSSQPVRPYSQEQAAPDKKPVAAITGGILGVCLIAGVVVFLLVNNGRAEKTAGDTAESVAASEQETETEQQGEMSSETEAAGTAADVPQVEQTETEEPSVETAVDPQVEQAVSEISEWVSQVENNRAWLTLVSSNESVSEYLNGDGDVVEVMAEPSYDAGRYTKHFFYRSGQPVYAEIFSPDEEIRLWYEGGELLRYADGTGAVVDKGNTDAVSDIGNLALAQAAEVYTFALAVEEKPEPKPITEMTCEEIWNTYKDEFDYYNHYAFPLNPIFTDNEPQHSDSNYTWFMYFENTDLAAYYYYTDTSSGWEGPTIKYGSDYGLIPIYFNNGVPSNSCDIYDMILFSDCYDDVWGICTGNGEFENIGFTTEYVYGDTYAFLESAYGHVDINMLSGEISVY